MSGATGTLRKLRELVGACEQAGWDGTENDAVLNGGREALADLEIVLVEATGEPTRDLHHLTFTQLRDINVRRCLKWQPAGLNDWSLDDWLVAIGGEVGEALNLVKKLNRERDGLVGNEAGHDQLIAMLADEIADAVIYLDLAMASESIELAGDPAADTFADLRSFQRAWPLPDFPSSAGRKALVALGAISLQADRFARGGELSYDKLFASAFALLCHLDELAMLAGIDLGAAVARKFNATSAKRCFPERLPEAAS